MEVLGNLGVPPREANAAVEPSRCKWQSLSISEISRLCADKDSALYRGVDGGSGGDGGRGCNCGGSGDCRC